MDRPRRRRRTGPWLAAVLALVALALGAYVWLRRPPLITLPVPPSSAPGPEPTPPPTVPPPAVTEPLAAPPGTAPDTPEERGLPPLAESDTLVRELASGLTSHPGLSVWLSTDGLIQRFVAVVEGDVELTPKVSTYAFADPALEGLSPAQKHLLRMGPKNERAIQAELRALATALGMG